MTVAELIAELQKMPSDAAVVQSKDSEGNDFSPTSDVSLGRYVARTTWHGEFGLLELNDALRAKGYTEDDVPDGPITVCLWPTN